MNFALGIRKTLCVSFWILYIGLNLHSGSLWGLFDRNESDTLTISLNIDVVGSAYVTAFVQGPGGTMVYQTPVLLTNVTNYTFSNFSLEAPMSGHYNLGVLVKGLPTATVTINTNQTTVTNSDISVILQGLSPSVVVGANQFAWLHVFTIYTDKLSGMLPP